MLTGLMLGACTVDGSVIDDLPCECADDFMCDVATNRCVPLGGVGSDAGSPTPDARVDTAPPLDAGVGDSRAPDAVARVDAGPDGGPDAGPLRDPDLGECIAGPADIFEIIDDERWGSTRDSVGMQSIDEGVFVTRIPAGNRSAYSFLFARERVDLSDCAAVIEMPLAQSGDDAVSFFSMRITNELGSIGFGVVRDELLADYYDGTETTLVWSADYDPEAHRWFAFRGDDGDLVWLLSADGRDWTEVGRRPAPIALDALQPLFGIGANSDNGSGIEARFDNYNNPL
jgi:hypothetical protein